MAGGIIRAIVTPHTPRMGIEESAPDFVKAAIKGSYELGEEIRAAKPDVLVVNSAHYVCTFNWYATTIAEHKGYAVADEAPDLIGGVPYRYRGDPEYGRAILDEIKALGYPTGANDSPHFQWDYGSWVPIKYIDPKAELPVILIGTCLAADLEECMRVGGAIRKAAEQTGRRVAFAASCSFTHKLVRGPEQWPSEERLAADRKFIQMLTKGRIAEAKAWFPEYTKFVVGEMGGRNIATMLGCIDDGAGVKYVGAEFGAYCQSSGSGNTSVSVRQAA